MDPDPDPQTPKPTVWLGFMSRGATLRIPWSPEGPKKLRSKGGLPEQGVTLTLERYSTVSLGVPEEAIIPGVRPKRSSSSEPSSLEVNGP